MKKTARRAKTRMSDQTGMTLGEVLVTVIIVGLVTAGLATAVSFGVREYSESMRVSESQQLFSSIQNTLDNELRYSSKITASNGTEYTRENIDTVTSQISVARFWSNNYGSGGTAASGAGHLDAIVMVDDSGETIAGAGQIALQNENDTIFRLIGKKAYNFDLVASVSDLAYKQGYFSYTLQIYKSGESSPMISEKLYVRALDLSTSCNTPKAK